MIPFVQTAQIVVLWCYRDHVLCFTIYMRKLKLAHCDPLSSNMDCDICKMQIPLFWLRKKVKRLYMHMVCTVTV